MVHTGMMVSLGIVFGANRADADTVLTMVLREAAGILRSNIRG